MPHQLIITLVYKSLYADGYVKYYMINFILSLFSFLFSYSWSRSCSRHILVLLTSLALTTDLVECAHRGTGGGYHIVDKEEQCILWAQVNPLANEEVELADGQIRWYQVFLLVQVRHPSLRRFLNNHLNIHQNSPVTQNDFTRTECNKHKYILILYVVTTTCQTRLQSKCVAIIIQMWNLMTTSNRYY